MLEAGATLPNVSVADDTGTTIALADYAGKRVVFWFYPKADTPG